MRSTRRSSSVRTNVNYYEKKNYSETTKTKTTSTTELGDGVGDQAETNFGGIDTDTEYYRVWSEIS